MTILTVKSLLIYTSTRKNKQKQLERSNKNNQNQLERSNENNQKQLENVNVKFEINNKLNECSLCITITIFEASELF